MDLEKLTATSILSDEILCEVMDEKDEIFRQRMILELTDRAKSLGVKSKFEQLLKAYIKVEKQGLVEVRNAHPVQQSFDNWTCFGDEHPKLFCGNWIADKTGVRTFGMYGEMLACYHPILPIERLTNIETGTEKITLAFCKGNRWREITVDKEQIATNTKITALSNLGVAVTSETSRYLVKYLSDIENANIDIIPEKLSTSKMGWIDGEFMPYHPNVVFDSDGNFKGVFDSLTEKGEYEKWLTLVLKYRSKGRPELKFYLAASFASVLVQPLNALPFLCNVYGGTGAGKSVAQMIATSIWADPSNNRYIADFTDTSVSTEVRMNFLNNLPLVMDDYSTLKAKLGDDFSEFIYKLCKGKGKGRSNRNLGINKEKTWRNVIFSSGETPLSNENLQGGAINRILELEGDSTPIFEDGQAVVDIISQNYGFAGRQFIEVVKDIGFEKITEMQKSIFEDIKKSNKMEKQSLSLSILLTADRIATDYIFKDGKYLGFDEVKGVLIDPNIVSENERCYDYILGEIAVNSNKFSTNSFGEYSNEIWGIVESGYVVIINNVFDKLCKKGGYSSKGFLNWAEKQGLIETSSGKRTKPKRINGNLCRCVFLKMKDDSQTYDEIDESELPFNV